MSGYTITIHAADQCEARHGYRPTMADGDAAVLDIVEGRALLVFRHGSGFEEWQVDLGPLNVRVVYMPAQSRIITVHPHEAKNRAKSCGVRTTVSMQPKYHKGKYKPGKTIWNRERP